jgi:hypothetical protein
LVVGMFRSFCPSGIISMQYADDTLIFLEGKMESVRNLKWILSCFNSCLV